MQYEIVYISKSYDIKNWDAKPKKPTWKQVGFFMYNSGTYCQQKRSIFNQIRAFVHVINSSTAQTIPNFCG